MDNINFQNTRYFRTAAKIADLPDDGLPEIALSGRSNVGKSSLVNSIANSKKLAKTSQKPGKTKQIIYFLTDNKLLFADLPGYGYSGASKSVTKDFSSLCDDYFRSGRNITLSLLLMDIRRDPSPEDVAMIEFCNQTAMPYFCVFTKCDKLSAQQVRNRLNEISKYLDFKDDAQIFTVSSLNGIGIGDLRDAIASMISLG
ncbi:MAG: ribosome biogenesis GTP-binding protein YihA/YsxC [Saccharofermentans sp.]|nr:ribosome biogenesis GTP-binding protein YihA/YsxC [Saccharofermentans sp.]